MAKRAPVVTLPSLVLDGTTGVPLHRQVYDGLRGAILAGRLVAGTRLPSTRALATELRVSRNSVLTAFDQLLAEGYLEGRVGSGTFVARALPDDLLRAHPATAIALRPAAAGRPISRRGAALAAATAIPPAIDWPDGMEQRAFRVGSPAFDAFPHDVWARILARRARRSLPRLLAYQDPAGHRPLREALAAYLGAARGVRCTAEQVIIVAGSQGALDLAARVLLDPGDPVWIEDPGYLGARGALLGAGARLVPVPTDGEGLRVADGVARCPGARLAFVTPSHQFPTGATMSLARRLALLEWAGRAGAWILEDDYDSEFRYAGRPLAALQGLDGEGRVVYLGTFSKTLFPALRLGYLVVPPDLVETFVAARLFAGMHTAALEQAALADFIVEGHFARHIRRMRALYAERGAALVAALGRDLPGLLDVRTPEAGMQLLARLPDGVDDRAAAHRAAAHGVDVWPLSIHHLEPAGRGGLLLGYAAVNEGELRDGVRRLATALRSVGGAMKDPPR